MFGCNLIASTRWYALTKLAWPIGCPGVKPRAWNLSIVIVRFPQASRQSERDSGHAAKRGQAIVVKGVAVRGDERAYARRLVRSITHDDVDRWSSGSAASWATESYRIARRLIYGEWPHEPGALPASYESAALPVANVQLEKAGVRLATVLNQAWRAGGHNGRSTRAGLTRTAWSSSTRPWRRPT
jgi:S1/P1 Nuclease